MAYSLSLCMKKKILSAFSPTYNISLEEEKGKQKKKKLKKNLEFCFWIERTKDLSYTGSLP